MHCYSIDCLGSSGGSAVVKEQLVWPKQQGLPGRLPGGKAGLGWVQDPSHRNQEMQTPKWKGGESYGGINGSGKDSSAACGEGGTEVMLHGAWPSRTMGHGVPVRCGRAAPGADHGAGPAPSAPSPQTRNHNASPVTSQICPKALLFRFL